MKNFVRLRINDVRMVKRLFAAVLQKAMGTITHVATQDPVAALTFDDGPHPRYTPRLLEILEKYQARATFFMVGEAAQKQQELVRLVAQAGHAIGNHSWDHPSLSSICGRDRRRQINDCANATAPYGQRLFRPPWGHQSIASRLDALRLGYQVVTWNVVAEDWLDHDADHMAKRLIGAITPGSIVLLHEAIYRSRFAVAQYDRESMLEALNTVLTRLGDRFRFITVPDILRHGRPVLRNWYRTN